MTTEAINDLIKSRRSIFPKFYSDEPIAKEVIEQMLENANWAPTHKFTEPWRFKVFHGEGLKKLASFQSELYKKKSTEKGTFEDRKYQKLATKPMMASHVIAIAMKRDEQRSVPEIEEISAVAMAVQNMYLTATAYGVGCYWGSGGITYLEEAKPFFDLTPDDKLLGFLYVGKLKGEFPGKGLRKPIADKVTWVG